VTLLTAPAPRLAGPVVHPPVALPDQARQATLDLGSDVGAVGTDALDAIPLPEALHDAVPQRQLEYRAGRACALAALVALAPPCVPETLPRGPSGAPRWPAGVTGSITHTRGYVSAAVASTRDITALAIDAEAIMPEPRVGAVEGAVALAPELALARAADLPHAVAVTLVFSIKEALFKCLHAHVGRVFGFHDVCVTGLSRSQGRFDVCLMRGLAPQLPAGTVLSGRFVVDAARVQTGIALARGTV
jgi:enterobactin synthetase component D